MPQNDFNKFMGTINKLKGSNQQNMVEEVARMIKSGEAGISAEKAKVLINAVLPSLESAQQVKLKQLLKML